MKKKIILKHYESSNMLVVPNLNNEINRNNAKVVTLIMNSITPKVFRDIENCNTAF